MKSFKFFVFLVFIVLMKSNAFGQTRKQLESQRKKYKSEIIKLNNLLFTEVKKQKNALDALKDINQKISTRNKLINTINLEARLLSNTIKVNERKIQKLNKDLDALKADYAEMIYKSYKSKSQQSRAMFLLSSQNFYQGYKRLEYMKQYTKFRKKQGEEIEVQTNFITKINDSLFYQKKVKDTLILAEKNQKEAIESDKKNQEILIAKIKKKEGKYKREIKNKQKEERRIATKIDKLIKAEIAKANAIARKKNTNKEPVSKKNDKFILSPEAKALAAKFEQNKGKLPWPVKDGLITRRFGVQPHPVFSGITINSTGLHFTTSNGNEAEAIFGGEVLNVLVGTGKTKNVMIRHGNYITSYKNLENSYVKKGDKIVTGQKIGKIFKDKVTNKTVLIFVLFKNTKRLNPSSWIMRR